MKIQTRQRDVVSTLRGERVGMTIAADAAAHIMSILTDLYSDPEMAVIREYSTNAFDSHIEAGVSRPIEVTLPSNLSPYFKVRDFGVGLDADGIREIYSQYGASTKRDSDDVVGMLGLGCKSALTYTDQFTLSGIKDGYAVQVAISRDADGGGSMTIVAEYETDEPNGVEVMVPVKVYNEFESKAKNFFRFWKPGTVLVNGSEPAFIDGTWIADDLLLTNIHQYNDYVVMGNVAYPTETRLSSIPYGWSVIAFVNIGEVNFTPSREALQMTSLTSETLDKLKKRIPIEQDRTFTKMIQDAASYPEALSIRNDLLKFPFDSKLVKYKGESIPDQIVSPEGKPFLLTTRGRAYGSGWSHHKAISTKGLDNYSWITGFSEENLTNYKRSKLNFWADANKIPNDRFVLVDSLPDTKWVNFDKTYKWDDVAAVKLPRKTIKRNGSAVGTYTVKIVDNGVSETQSLVADDIPTNHPIFYSLVGEYDAPSFQLALKQLPNFALVTFTRNRLNKFLRTFPNAKLLNNYLYDNGIEWLNQLTENEKDYLTSHRTLLFSVLSKLDSDRVNCKIVRDTINMTRISNGKELISKHDVFYRIPEVKETLADSSLAEKLSGYPLLLTLLDNYVTLTDAVLDDIYLYLNAAYAAKGRK